jgi:membrane associated rhomboid family serine protease
VTLYENLLVFAAILLSLTLLRLARRRDPGQRLYTLVVVAELVLTTAAMFDGDRFLGLCAMGLCGLTVALPWLLERAARQAFGLGLPRWGVRMTGLRALLMPGAGLGRQQQILAGFGLLDRKGPAAALAHFRALLAEAEDPSELVMIHEQIVAMLLYDLRWSEAVAHYESQFQPGYAALRPALVVGMLKAFGELGRMREAGTLLRALEEGPLGHEAGAVELVAQARLTFLAYAGAATTVDAAVTGERGKSLGLSPASVVLLQATAAACAGDEARARAILQGLPQRPKRRDERALVAARALQEQLPRSATPLDEGLDEQVLRAALSLREQAAQGRSAPRSGGVLVTSLLIAAMVGSFVVALWHGLVGVGLLRMGAFTPELWRAGSWGRLFTAPFVHADLLGLLLDVYSIWLAGHVLERILGRARMGLAAIGGAAAGLWAAGQGELAPALIVGGGNAMAVAVLVATLWTLLPARTPGVAAPVRRSLMVTLLLLLGAQLLSCVPGDVALRSTPLALGAAAFVGSLVAVALPPTLANPLRRGLSLLLVGLLGFAGVGVYRVTQEDPIGFALAHREARPAERGVIVALPRSFERVAAAGEHRPVLLPVYQGWLDAQALRGGALVQVMVVEGATAPGGSALFRVDPGLLRELAVQADDALADDARAILSAAAGSWSTYLLRRNGEAVARVIERRLGEAGPTVVLVAAPPQIFDQAPGLYARLVADAALVSSGGPAGD